MVHAGIRSAQRTGPHLGRLSIRVTSSPPGCTLAGVMPSYLGALTSATAGASGPQPAAGIRASKDGPSAAGDRSGPPVGAGRGAYGVVDGEVINGEPTRGTRCGLGPVDIGVSGQFCAGGDARAQVLRLGMARSTAVAA